ncbi:hypothetical protein C7382_1019 [Porphyromonas loveana]|uniref:Uncharacterized protein n=1 Tax=Porphyromonas loveana TaxID=1884669 RepID=A0A2U1FSC3_9PORP|nr:hypothetical protein C7382_1019 [Porphyromonas loveana]
MNQFRLRADLVETTGRTADCSCVKIRVFQTQNNFCAENERKSKASTYERPGGCHSAAMAASLRAVLMLRVVIILPKLFSRRVLLSFDWLIPAGRYI